MRSLSYVTRVYHNPRLLRSTIFHQRYNITPPPKKPALRLYMSILYPQGILIFMLNRQPIIFTILALYPLVKVLQGSRFIRVLVIKFFKSLGAAYKVLGRILSQVQIIAFLLNMVLQHSLYQFIGQYFVNFLFIITINLNWQGRLILLFRQ